MNSKANLSRFFEHRILIHAPIERVDRTITDRELMHQWLNPLLRCEPVGEWSSDVGSQSCFTIQVPLWAPTLASTVIERRIGLVVWEFDGFFKGCDHWECFEKQEGTQLVNRFEFQIPSPWVAIGFKIFAASLTRRDMQAQLVRLKRIAETKT
jgi:hypothetical protein